MPKDAKTEEDEATSKGPAKQKSRTVESAATASTAETIREEAKSKPAARKDRVVTAVTDGPEHVSPPLTDISKEKEAKRKDRTLYGKLMVNGRDPR